MTISDFVADEEVSAFFFELDVGPLTSSRMVDWLSWKRMFCSTDYPCASMKFCVWRIEGRAWSAPTSLDSDELLVFILCLCEKLMAATLASDIIALVWLCSRLAPVWPLQSSWTAVRRLPTI